MMKKLEEYLIYICFVVFGIFMISQGITAVFNAGIKPTDVKTTAHVVNVSKHTDSEGKTVGRVYVTYNVDGKTYNGMYNTNANVEKGSEQTVYYDRENPSIMKAWAKEDVQMSLFGIPFLLAGVAMIYQKLSKEILKKKLLQSGEKMYVELETITSNKKYKVNGKHPYIIVCKEVDNITGEIRRFKSDNLWNNPAPIIAQKNITTFPVYIDKTDTNKYYLSVEEIEKGTLIKY